MDIIFFGDPQINNPGQGRNYTDSPAHMIGRGNFTCAYYINENTLNEKDAKVSAEYAGMCGLLNFKAPRIGRSAVAFNLEAYDFNAYGQSGGYTALAERDFKKWALSIGASPFEDIKAGISISSDKKAVIEALISPNNAVTLGYRRYYPETGHITGPDGGMDLLLMSEDDNILFEMPSVVHMDEFSIGIGTGEDWGAVVKAGAGHFLSSTESSLWFKPISGLTIEYGNSSYGLGNSGALIINGSSGGFMENDFNINANSLTAVISPEDSAWRAHAGVKQGNIDLKSTGRVEKHYSTSFWEGASPSERFFEGLLHINHRQYMAGYENTYLKMLRLAVSGRFIDAQMQGAGADWKPFPYVGIGRFDEQTSDFPYKSAQFWLLSLNAQYRFKSFALTYGISQIIPWRLVMSDGSADEFHDSYSDLDGIRSEFNNPSGGTRQGIELQWEFGR